jgi:hypothetical protein
MKNFKFDEESIYSLWQNPVYKEQMVDMYRYVNHYLWYGSIYKSKNLDNILKTFDMGIKDFENFTIKYINALNDLLYKKERESIILYRGESRLNFDVGVGDVLIYNNFHSTCDNISFALKFTENNKNPEKTTIILSLDIPAGSFYKKLNKTLKTYDKKLKTTYYINEFEYLIPPNCYYRITEIVDTPRKIKIVKAKLILQEKFIIERELNYVNKKLPFEKIKDFTDKNTDNFIFELDRFDKMIQVLSDMKKYQIDDDVFSFLNGYNERIFNYDLESIQKVASTTNKDNFKENVLKFDELKFDYYNIKLYTEFDNYIKGLQYFGLYDFGYENSSFKQISNFKLYMGTNNVTGTMKTPKIIEEIKSRKNGIFDEILYCQLAPDCYLYNCAYNDYKPNIDIEKSDKKITQYYQYIFEFNLFDVKIAISNKIRWKLETDVLIIPKNKYILRKTETNSNKYNFPIEILYIDLIGT